MLFILLSFFPFAPPVSYFIPSRNSLFSLQAVNCMHASVSAPYALHFPGSDLRGTDQALGDGRVLPTGWLA